MDKAVFFIALTIAFFPEGGTRSPMRHTDLDPSKMVRGLLYEKNRNSFSYPDSLQLIGSYTTQGKARDVWVEYPYAYLASDWLGVEVLDISDPTNPTLVNTIDTPGQAFDILRSDTLTYVADDYSGFQILDGSGIVGGFDTPRIDRGIFVQGNYAYIADHESLLVFDVYTPATPVQVGSLYLDYYSGTRGIFVKGSYAYVADEFGPILCGTPNGYIWIVDISNPSAPALAGYYCEDTYYFFPYNVYVKDSIAYVANYFNELFIIDVSNPANPFRLSFAFPPTGFAWDVKVSGNRAYVANYDGGLWIVNISNPVSPQTAAIYDTPGFASGVYVDSPYVYVADYYSLLIFEHFPTGLEEQPVFSDPFSVVRLYQNQPNPFQNSTLIRYQIPLPPCLTGRQALIKGEQGGFSVITRNEVIPVRLVVYDITGSLVKILISENQKLGVHEIHWDGKDERGKGVSSGVYFYKLQAESHSKTRKMTILR